MIWAGGANYSILQLSEHIWPRFMGPAEARSLHHIAEHMQIAQEKLENVLEEAEEL